MSIAPKAGPEAKDEGGRLPQVEAATDLADSSLYLNRELSELAFQRRVLNEALDERNPLLERTRFLSIFTANMDEFFMKRIGGLKEQVDAGVQDRTADGRTPAEQWVESVAASRPLFERQAACWEEELRPALAAAGIRIVDFAELDRADRMRLSGFFEESIFATLTPLTLDAGHPFPFLSNLSLSLAVLTLDDGVSEPKFSRLKIPTQRPRLVRVGDSTTFVTLEEIIAASLEQLFPNVEILGHWAFRVTRNAEVRRNEEVADDLADSIEEMIRERRFAAAVRLETGAETPGVVRRLLMSQLELDEEEHFSLRGLLDYRCLDVLQQLDRRDLELRPWTPQPHPRLLRQDGNGENLKEEVDIFAELQRGDVLVHHPYHSFDGTVNEFFRQAARDPGVLVVKSTIYRTATESKVIASLVEAAHAGKQVAVMVEVQARFDEENNLKWVEHLEDEGIHVAYGVLGFKSHAKITLVVRQEGEKVRYYSHVGTGNYHSGTARGYTDLGLLTADDVIGRDLARLFNLFTARSEYHDYEKLLVAPTNMRRTFRDLIRREAEIARAGGEGRIVAKLNSLEDAAIVRELYEASRAGVEIDLLVRGICRLRSGVPGVSETVRVRSIVGRFLEHSRIYHFAGGGEPRTFIGSADWMTRNLDKRVEACVPVEGPALQQKLYELLELMLRDNRRSWEMQPDGTYRQRRPAVGEETIDTHEVLMKRALAGAVAGRSTAS